MGDRLTVDDIKSLRDWLGNGLVTFHALEMPDGHRRRRTLFLAKQIDALRKENAEMAARVAIRAFAAKKAGGV